ncbi:SPX domain-containing protein 1-like [Impatiens glandulifera]|uniref:SPX domain-containing protein 1-like n=1 Tax=Impatiens glandulifera TaxID=253017 RepID=UPI001FB1395B|nr:SPX domain-containing protein 1-like [Impatiens glandulifera]
MKFGKSLTSQIEATLPEWRDKFLSYKELKKRLKMIGGDDRESKRPKLSFSGSGIDNITKEENDFIDLLEIEIEKFNSFFIGKEEDYIIKLKDLQDRVMDSDNNNEDIIRTRKEIVDFHGEMVLLSNYSSINYIGLVKILKKYDKSTGAVLRLPFIQKVLQQPFFMTDLLYRLINQCDALHNRVLPATATANGTSSSQNVIIPAINGPEMEYVESLYMRSTRSALRAMQEIRKGSSTVSALSLPPLQLVAD